MRGEGKSQCSARGVLPGTWDGGLGEATWPEAEAAAPGAVLAVPLGATEQHGPHLPLDADTRIAVALAAGAAAACRARAGLPPLLVAPAVPYGSSGEHASFPGTLSIGREATELLLVELCRSAADSFDRLLLVSAHGGNLVPVNRAVRRLRDEGRDVRAWSPRWRGDAHAGRLETSLLLAVAPESVRRDRAEAGNAEPLERLFGALAADGVRAVSANGVLGDPAGASAAEGRRLLDGAIADLVAGVAAWPSRGHDEQYPPAGDEPSDREVA